MHKIVDVFEMSPELPLWLRVLFVEVWQNAEVGARQCVPSRGKAWHVCIDLCGE